MGRGIALNALDEPYIAGVTYGDIPLEDPFDDSYDPVGDAFLMRLSETGQTLLYSTYIGGDSQDDGHDMAINTLGKLSVIGKTKSQYRFPAFNGFDTDYNGGLWDGFVINFDEGLFIFTHVWPGDLDNNGIVNVEDILPLAEYWHETGPSRGIIDYGWYAHEALEWDIPSATYADGYGDGRIDTRDLFSICVNWGLTHAGIMRELSPADNFNIEDNKDILLLIYELVKNAHDGPQYEIRKYIEELLSGPLPREVSLYQNFPNPFNLTTTIEYYLPFGTMVNIKIYNIAGQSVRTLVSSSQKEGSYEVIWDGCDDNGQIVSSGIYFYRLEIGGSSQMRKMLLLK
jgi:hypothetical protein